MGRTGFAFPCCVHLACASDLDSWFLPRAPVVGSGTLGCLHNGLRQVVFQENCVKGVDSLCNIDQAAPARLQACGKPDSMPLQSSTHSRNPDGAHCGPGRRSPSRPESTASEAAPAEPAMAPGWWVRPGAGGLTKPSMPATLQCCLLAPLPMMPLQPVHHLPQHHRHDRRR